MKIQTNPTSLILFIIGVYQMPFSFSISVFYITMALLSEICTLQFMDYGCLYDSTVYEYHTKKGKN